MLVPWQPTILHSGTFLKLTVTHVYGTDVCIPINTDRQKGSVSVCLAQFSNAPPLLKSNKQDWAEPPPQTGAELQGSLSAGDIICIVRLFCTQASRIWECFFMFPVQYIRHHNHFESAEFRLYHVHLAVQQSGITPSLLLLISAVLTYNLSLYLSLSPCLCLHSILLFV
jgi:hypothetical protein